LVVDAFERGGAVGTREVLRRHGLLLAGIGIPGTTGLAVLAPNITGVILPPTYGAEARMIVPLVAFAVLLGGLKAHYFDFSFQLSHRTRRQLAVVFLAAATNLGLNLLWIPRFGALGAAYATLIAYGVGFTTSWVLGRGLISIPIPGRDLLKIVGASAGMGLLLWRVRDYAGPVALIGQIALGAMGYAAVAVAFDVGGVRGLILSQFRSRGRRAASTPSDPAT
jgi:O-antigen/teichoic acid export membrane protein